MNCPRNEDVSAYIDDMMTAGERRRFMRHLDACPPCQVRRDALIALQARLRGLPSPSLGFDLAAQFEERMRTGAVRIRPVRRWFNWGSAGAAVALSLAAGVWLGSLLIGSAVAVPSTGAARVFDPVPPGGLCAAQELCRLKKGTS